MAEGIRGRRLARNIILTGFMGSGKTVVGRELARILGWRFTDLDRMIAVRAGMGVAEIFKRRGEPAFRRMEHQSLRALGGMRRYVVAAGGGTPVFPRNRPLLRKAGLVVYLRAGVPILVRRLARSRGRPLLAPARGDRAALRRLIAGLLRKREPAYRTAGVTVNAGAGSPARVAMRVAAKAGLAGKRRGL